MDEERSSTPSTFHPPEDSPPPPPSSPSRSEKVGWLSSLVSGAGKFISSVFGSDSSDSYSSAGSSEEDTDGSFYVEEDAAHSPTEHGMQIEKSSFGNDWLGAKSGSLSIVSEIEPKCAIEQLVLQETFTRDEGYKLTKIIQSRVIDDQSADFKWSDMQPRTGSKVIASQGTIQCLDRLRIRPECIHHSSSRSSACLSPDSSSLFDLGLCNLNRDITQFDFQNEFDSPVKVAKSYMMSLACHQATPPSAMHLYVDGESPGSSPCFLSSTFRKRKFNTSIFGDTFDNNRRVRFRSTWNLSSIPKITEDKTSSDRTDVETFHQPDDQALRDGNTIAASDISDAITAANTISSDHDPILIPLSLQVSDPDTIILPVKRDVGKKQFSMGIKDGEQPSENEEQLENVVSPVVTRGNGVHQQDIVYSARKVLANKDANYASSSSAGLRA